jgi:hypothetical protein
MKLELCIYKENKHNSRINIFGIYKIVINSPEVCFGMKRQYAKVGCKNPFIFGYKKSFMQILQKWKNIFVKSFTT